MWIFEASALAALHLFVSFVFCAWCCLKGEYEGLFD